MILPYAFAMTTPTRRPKSLHSLLSVEERDTFRQAMTGVTPLGQASRRAPTHSPLRLPMKRHFAASQTLIDDLSDPVDGQRIDTPEVLQFHRSGIQATVLKKLRRGGQPPQASLDLHGYTVAEARRALIQYLNEANSLSRRCLLIVHGKGHGSGHRGPILKTCVNHWLQQRADVLAFCTAPISLGGTGAVLVLLRS